MTDGAESYQDTVFLEGVWKSYGKHAVLKGADVAVAKGSIYGLLGPSGCGKTTMLRCIVGRLLVDKGTIKVFGHLPGSKASEVPGRKVGYMPQELALLEELTVHETLRYFGLIHHMDRAKVDYRTSFLLEFLNLPTEWRLIKNLSGGQKRRVSFAAALLHEPPLLILDEPTVGVDPLLRQSIWKHLLDITKSGNVTIIVTTHYIEEARQANRVGLMRSGRLLAEAQPEFLLRQHSLPSLEDVFLKLCNEDRDESPASATEADLAEISSENQNLLSQNAESTEMLYIPDKTAIKEKGESFVWFTPPSLRRIRALTIKNFIKMIRMLGFLAFQFIIPSVQIVLFCLAIGGDPKHVSVAVVNQDNSTYLGLSGLGAEYLAAISSVTVDQINASDQQTALDMVLNGQAWGMVHIGANFTEDLGQRFTPGAPVSDDVIDGGSVHVRLDMTDQQIGYTLQRTFLSAFQDLGTAVLNETGQNPRLASTPVMFDEPVYGSTDPSYTEYMAPGMILSITYFMAVGLTALSFVIERKDGLLDRSYVAGVNSVEIMMSHVITQFGVMIIQVGLVLFILIVAFGLPCKGSIFWVICLTILQGTCGMTYGFLISTVCDYENTAIMMSLGSFYPNLLLSGIMWPLEAMPKFLQYISYALPQTFATQAMRCVLSRGQGITFMPVWRGYLVTLAWIGMFLVLSATAMRLRRQ